MGENVNEYKFLAQMVEGKRKPGKTDVEGIIILKQILKNYD